VNAPIISAALVTPSLAGVEMIARVNPTLFASSNDARSIMVWKSDGTFAEEGIRIQTTLCYDPAVGVANDGTTTEVGGARYFVTGHANGFLLVWCAEEYGKFTLVHTLDLRSPSPISSPFPLANIRGVERWKPGYVVTGSEDGDLCLVNVVEGAIVARMRYNASAQRGVNDIDTSGDFLVLANCSVGHADKNLWLYRVHEGGFELLDSVNLKVDGALDQVFNFCVDQAVVDGKHYFFAATQEGVVWMGLVENGHLAVLGKQDVSTRIGAALAYEPTSRLLAVAGDNLHLFEMQ
jgi:WD40 repeat protein